MAPFATFLSTNLASDGIGLVPRYIVFIAIFSAAFIVTIHVHAGSNGSATSEMREALDIEIRGVYHRVQHSTQQRLTNTSAECTSSSQHFEASDDGSVAGSVPPGGRDRGHSTFSDDLKISTSAFLPPDTVHDASRIPGHGGGIRDFATALPFGSRGQHHEPRGRSTALPGPRHRNLKNMSGTPPLAADSPPDLRGNYARAPSSGTDSATEELLIHRHSIEKHLRILFLYPTSYMSVWTFPFVSQCFQLTGRQFETQPLWLQVVMTVCLRCRRALTPLFSVTANGPGIGREGTRWYQGINCAG